MPFPIFSAVVLALLLFCQGVSAEESPMADRCAVPGNLLADLDPLPRTAVRLRQGGEVRIVAIGGASTRGVGPPDQSYPSQLQAELGRRYPQVTFQVTNLGVARQSAYDMARRLAGEVLPTQPVLVIWETGTNDAVRAVDVGDFEESLKAGMEALSQAEVDTILVDMQYSRETASVINFDPYLEIMRNMADIYHVRMFRRYDMMKFWNENGTFDFSAPKGERMLQARRVYECIARRLADSIGQGTR